MHTRAHHESPDRTHAEYSMQVPLVGAAHNRRTSTQQTVSSRHPLVADTRLAVAKQRTCGALTRAPESLSNAPPLCRPLLSKLWRSVRITDRCRHQTLCAPQLWPVRARCPTPSLDRALEGVWLHAAVFRTRSLATSVRGTGALVRVQALHRSFACAVVSWRMTVVEPSYPTLNLRQHLADAPSLQHRSHRLCGRSSWLRSTAMRI